MRSCRCAPVLLGPLDPFAPVPPEVPVRTWNLCGYRTGHAPPTPDRHVFGGLSDAAFRQLPVGGICQQSHVFGTRVFPLVRPAAKSSMLRTVASMIWPTAVRVK